MTISPGTVGSTLRGRGPIDGLGRVRGDPVGRRGVVPLLGLVTGGRDLVTRLRRILLGGRCWSSTI